MARPEEKVQETGPAKVPPHNLEAEQAILGGILINNEAMNLVMDILSEGDFYREAHGHLFAGMVDLYNNSEPVDLITLSNHLKQRNLLDKSGGPEYMASLADSVSTSAGIAHHAQIVRDLSIRRRLIRQCSMISDSCFQSWDRSEELLD
ncbi:MAG: DnaB-like helicase N-terminal domain-containing protein, partial [Desulfobacteraceae bacterium]